MVMTDPISDLLTRIRNANLALQTRVDIPASKIKIAIVQILKEEGFIRNFRLIRDRKQGILRIYLKFSPKGERVIQGLERISKPGRRIYRSSQELPKVLSGLGISIVSTPKGILTDKQANHLNVGGEILCSIW